METSVVTESIEQLSVLLVDDVPFDLNLTESFMRRIGYENTLVANSGKSALEKLAEDESNYEIIILDLNMPEMDGLQLLRHLSGIGFCGGIILLSGEDRRMLETALGLARSHQLNILGAISKPLDPVILEKMLGGYKRNVSEKYGYASQKSISLEELKSGLEGSSENQLELVYQPKVSVKTGKVVSVEALARWQSAERGLLGPATFIPLAEESCLIDSLSFQVYEKALTQSAVWQNEGIFLNTAVNFSINSFAKPEFCNRLVDIATQQQVNSNQIVLEITESQAIEIALDCLEALLGMRLKRFNLSIDDFGTGNSSMAQLKNIPFTELKIDRAFVTGASKGGSALAILEASVDLAKKLNMEIVAEGAESRADWDLVAGLGCDYVQGYYCAKPMSNGELMSFLQKWNGPH